MAAPEIALRLRVGARTLLTLRRRLVRRRVTLEEALAGRAPALDPLEPGDDGYFVTGLPDDAAESLPEREKLRPFVRQRYTRYYADLGSGFDSWLAGLSSRTRSTLKRKARRLTERSGGALDLRCYRTAAEMDEFYRHARGVSALTYQERLLRAGLPEGPEELAEMCALAARGEALGWLLWVDGRPISYLYAPAEGASLVYAFLGYDPDFADFSPGTVLQLEAMRQLMDERRFAWFDFAEGEGRHKQLFATGRVACVDLLLVRRTLANLAAGHGLNAFDGAAELAKRTLAAAAALRRSAHPLASPAPQR